MKDFILGVLLSPTLRDMLRANPPQGWGEWLDRIWIVGVVMFFWADIAQSLFTN
jgi:hypothetical protein